MTDGTGDRLPGAGAGRRIGGAYRVHAFFVAVVTLFFLQDIVNIVLLHAGLGSAVPMMSALKEALVLAFCAIYLAANLRRLRFQPGSLALALVLAAIFTLYIAIGLTRFPAIGVAYELRTLAMPLMLMLAGWMYGDAVRRRTELANRLVRLYVGLCVVVALSAFIDYAFLGDDFWTAVNLGELERVKGYEGVAIGALPDNMYSFYFGRRAFGLAFNPLNLAYVLVPAVVIAWCRRRWLLFAVLATAMVLSWSRQPIVATAAVLAASMLAPLALVALALLASPVAAWYLQVVYLELVNDPSALGHFATVAIGLAGIVASPLGYGIGAAGVFAGAYSTLSVESVFLNVANQIGLPGLALYVAVLAAGLRRAGPLARELRLMAAIYAITAFLSPHVLTIKSTFGFFLFLGMNLALPHIPAHVRRARNAPGGLGFATASAGSAH